MTKVRLKRIPTDKEILDMLFREDYYQMLKIRHSPKDKLGITWNVLRSKWSILSQFGKL